MVSKRDYYEVLGVAREADEDTLKRAYRKLAMQYHPDRNVGDAEAEGKFKEASEAYEVLRDPEKRRIYDRYGHAGLENVGLPNFHDTGSIMDIFGDLLGDLFGGGGGRRRPRGPRPGRDLQIVMEIDLVEAYHGVTRTITVPRQERCSECGGNGAKRGTQPSTCRNCGGRGSVWQTQGFFRIEQTCPGCRGRGSVLTDPCGRCLGNGAISVDRTLEVKVPAGVDNDMSIRLSGEGENGEPGAPPGDLYCVLRVRKHPLFVRDGQSLHCELPVTFSQAALGGVVEVPTLEGKFLNHTLKRGTQAGDEVHLTGRGMPSVRGGRAGDLVVHVRVVTPTNLSRRQDELLRELGDLDGKNISPERKSWFDRVKAFFSSVKPADPSAR
jgi:molecular chaperone DnaJ